MINFRITYMIVSRVQHDIFLEGTVTRTRYFPNYNFLHYVRYVKDSPGLRL